MPNLSKLVVLRCLQYYRDSPPHGLPYSITAFVNSCLNVRTLKILESYAKDKKHWEKYLKLVAGSKAEELDRDWPYILVHLDRDDQQFFLAEIAAAVFGSDEALIEYVKNKPRKLELASPVVFQKGKRKKRKLVELISESADPIASVPAGPIASVSADPVASVPAKRRRLPDGREQTSPVLLSNTCEFTLSFTARKFCERLQLWEVKFDNGRSVGTPVQISLLPGTRGRVVMTWDDLLEKMGLEDSSEMQFKMVINDERKSAEFPQATFGSIYVELNQNAASMLVKRRDPRK
ncbi:hypothetical protein VTK73DRAFT_1301 [Phialemonium thermophilum]|uniref:Uncharacterized protein n=1 Tax=Phialemonium thermophilum TaxID=223376 RepID=A0ABR3XAY4_9PEZI